MNPNEQLKALLAEATAIEEKKTKGGLEDEDYDRIPKLTAEIKDVRGKIESGNKFAAEFKAAGALQAKKDEVAVVKTSEDPQNARSLGEFVVKSLGADGFRQLQSGRTMETASYKAATDTQVTPQGLVPGFLTTYDPNIVRGYRRPLVTSLFSQGAISGTRIVYFTESPTIDGPPSQAITETARNF